MPTTLSADTLPVLRLGSACGSHSGRQCSTRGSAPCAHGALTPLLPSAGNSRKALWCLRCPPMLSAGSIPAIRSPWPRPAKRFPRAGPKMPPRLPHARSSACAHTVTHSPPGPAKPHEARLGAPRCPPPAPRRRPSPADASLDAGAHTLLPPPSCSGCRTTIPRSCATASAAGRLCQPPNSPVAPPWSVFPVPLPCARPPSSRPAWRPSRPRWP